MEESKYTIFTLENGLRCLHGRAKGLAAYCGIVVGAGSRDEQPDKFGLAHFVEHTIFKGTRRRKSWYISNRMESIGGELNAYTSKESTVVFTNAPCGYTDRALELLADLVENSIFPAPEIERERGVVIEEINSYLDSPAETAYDLFEDRLFAGSGMGHNILGTPESVRGLSGSDCRAFLDRYYVPENMIIYCFDNNSPARVEKMVRKYFGVMNHPFAGHNRNVPTLSEPFCEMISNGGHQAHTILGTLIFGRGDDRRFAMSLLNNLLAGPGMNSILNQQLRERRGYVYTVDGTMVLYEGIGMYQIYLGSEENKIDKCKTLIMREVENLAAKPLTPSKFSAAKRQYIGQVMVSSEQAESMYMSLGKNLLYGGPIMDVNRCIEAISKVTAEDLRDCARLLLDNGFSSLTVS